MAVKHVTDEDFEKEVLKSEVPVIVDFWAEWCGPCKMMGPVFEKLSGDFPGKLKFAKLDTDENQATAAKYGIMSIPTLLVFKDGRPHSKLVGFRPEAAFKKDLEALVSEL